MALNLHCLTLFYTNAKEIQEERYVLTESREAKETEREGGVQNWWRVIRNMRQLANKSILMSKYVAESIKQLIAGRFGHVGLRQLRTKQFCMVLTKALVRALCTAMAILWRR